MCLSVAFVRSFFSEHTEPQANLIESGSQVIHEAADSTRQSSEQSQQSTSQQQQIVQQQQQQQAIKPKQSLIQPPKILPLTAQCVQQGETVKFESTFTGVPTPLLSWFKDKKPLKFTQEIQMEQDDKSCSLVIKNVKLSDSAFYTLLGENEAGQSKTTAQLLVVEDASQVGETVVTTTTKNESDDAASSSQAKPKKKLSKKKKQTDSA